jgi:type IV pilus assembly protein PilA
MKSVQKGFTLIELMIVVAIIAILAAIAIPAYQDYLIRSQVSEGASLADAAKTAAAEYFSNHGSFPTGNTGAGVATASSIQGKYVKSVTVNNGVVTALFSSAAPQVANSKLDQKVLAFSPIDNGGSISWHCATATTTIDAKYLPTSCRGANQ